MNMNCPGGPWTPSTPFVWRGFGSPGAPGTVHLHVLGGAAHLLATPEPHAETHLVESGFAANGTLSRTLRAPRQDWEDLEGPQTYHLFSSSVPKTRSAHEWD